MLDIILPGRSGWALLESIRTASQFSAIPVVVASLLDEQRRSLELGAVAHLTKPVDAEQILAVLASCVGSGADAVEAARGAAMAAHAAERGLLQ